MEKELDYPEHEKLKAIKDKSQAIGEFIDWLDERGIYLSEYHYGELFRTVRSIRDLLAEFFDIDQNKLEDEKLDMLKEVRRLNAERSSQ